MGEIWRGRLAEGRAQVGTVAIAGCNVTYRERDIKISDDYPSWASLKGTGGTPGFAKSNLRGKEKIVEEVLDYTPHDALNVLWPPVRTHNSAQ